MANLGKIVLTQDPAGSKEERIEVYSFGEGFIKIPTEIQKPSWLLHQILGARCGDKDMLVSPNFGTATEVYSKLIDRLRTPASGGMPSKNHSGERTHFLTDEDSVRFWAARNPDFITELVNDGWMHFEEFEHIDENDQKELEPFSRGSMYNYRQARVPISSLIRIMDRPGLPYCAQVSDLKELQQHIGFEADNTTYVYQVGGGLRNSFFYADLARNVKLVLSGMESFLPEDERFKQCALKRKICFRIPIPIESPFRSEIVHRICALTEKYVNKKGNDVEVSISQKDDEIHLFLKNGGRPSEERCPNPDTGALIARAGELEEFVNRAISLEQQEIEGENGRIFEKRMSALGL